MEKKDLINLINDNFEDGQEITQDNIIEFMRAQLKINKFSYIDSLIARGEGNTKIAALAECSSMTVSRRIEELSRVYQVKNAYGVVRALINEGYTGGELKKDVKLNRKQKAFLLEMIQYQTPEEYRVHAKIGLSMFNKITADIRKAMNIKTNRQLFSIALNNKGKI